MQHKDIVDAQLHEPKGVASSLSNTAYFSTGAGTGVWKKAGTETFKGLTGDGGVSDKLLLTDGLGGIKIVPAYAYANMQINNNAVNLALTAVADTTFNTASQYTLLTGAGAPFVNTVANGITFDTNKLTVAASGVYELSCWTNIALFPSISAKAAFKFKISNTTFSTSKVVVKSNSNGDYGALIAFDFVPLVAGDYVQLYVASDTTGNIRFENSNLTLKLIKAT